MKKESLSVMTVKTLLAVLLFAGIGTIIIGGGYLIVKWKSNVPISSIPTEGCAKAGEGSSNPSLGPSAPTPRKCCEGLVEIYTGLRYEPDNEHANEAGCIHLEGSANICSDCENGICESWENRCNCPEDCVEEMDASDWQTYRNEEFGFEVKYPSNYIGKEKENYVLWLDNKDTIENNEKWHEEHPNVPGPINSDFISIKNYDNKNGLSLKEWFSNTLKNELRSTAVEDYYIGNTHALKTAIPSTCSNYKIFISDQENIIIEIETCAADFDDKDNYFVKFLSTFKFIEK